MEYLQMAAFYINWPGPGNCQKKDGWGMLIQI